MRLLGLCCVLVAGCIETGAHLTFSAPNGPTSAMSFSVVLATPDRVPLVNGQRTSPTKHDVQSVSYYLQRTIAGGEHNKVAQLDGFAVRIEPDISISETAFIPFVLIYDGENETGNIIAIATFVAPDSHVPSPILVKLDEIDKYTLTVEPVVQVSDREPAAAGQVQVVKCGEGEQEFVSGIVWRPKSGGELRLVFADDGGLDATKRALDLDCDGHTVTIESSGGDCDDSRGWFHRGAPESCDGFDTNCDSLETIAVACPATSNLCPDPTAGTGVALCHDTSPPMQAQCQSDAQCLCAGLGSVGCTKCILEAELGATAGTVTPCQPGIGFLYLDQLCMFDTKCRVEVVGVRGGWVVEVGGDTVNFGPVALDVVSKFYIKATRPEGVGAEIQGVRGTSTGEVDVVVTTSDGVAHLIPIDLQLTSDPPSISCSNASSYPMYCTRQ